MFSVSSVCDEEDRVVQYGEDHPSISGISSHDLESHADLVSVQGHVIGETDGQDGALVQPDGTNIQGSYVSLLADTATIDRTDEFTSRPLDTELTDNIQYSVTNFSGKTAVQDLVSGGTLPTSLQTDPLISYENQNLGYGLTSHSQPSNMPSQCLPQFVIFQNFGSSVITPADGNNAFIQMANTADTCTPMITESNKELEDAVANISDNVALINPAGDILTNDQSYLVSTNNQGEIQNIQIVPGATLDEQNSEVKDLKVQKKSKASKVVKKKKKKIEKKPKERSTEVKKFSVDELNTEGETKTKQQLYEEYIGMTESGKVKKKTDNSKPANDKVKSADNNFTEAAEVEDSNDNVADVIHVRIEKPPEEYGEKPLEQFEAEPQTEHGLKPPRMLERPNDSTNELNTDTINSNKTGDNIKPIDNTRQLPTPGTKTLEEVSRNNLNTEESTKVTLETTTSKTEVQGFKDFANNDNLVREVKIEVKHIGTGDSQKVVGTSDKICERTSTGKRSNERLGETIGERSNQRSSTLGVEEKGSRKRRQEVKDDTRRQLKRKGPGSLKIDKSGKQRKLDTGTCDDEVEGRMIEDFCRIFGTEDKCILRVKPITLNLIKPNNQLVVEIYVEDSIHISSISQSNSSDGLVKHCMHFEHSASDKAEKNVISNTSTRNVCTTTKVKTGISEERKNSLTNTRKRKKSPKYTGLNKKNAKKKSVDVKKENVPCDVTEANVPVTVSDHPDLKLANVSHSASKDNVSKVSSNLKSNLTSDTISTDIVNTDVTSNMIPNITAKITSDTTSNVTSNIISNIAANTTSNITNMAADISSDVCSNITSGVTDSDMIEADNNINDDHDNDDGLELDSTTVRFDDSGGDAVMSVQCDTGLIDSRTFQPDMKHGAKKNKNKMAAKHENKSNTPSEMPEPPKDYVVRITDEGVRMFTCPTCGYSSRYPQNARKHIREHTAARDWTCEICGLGFKSNNHLQKHKAVHEPARPFTCHLCHKMFKSKKVYQCLICRKEINVRLNMETHVNQHFGQRPYQCEVCGLAFVSPSNLKTHMHQHESNMRFTCEICSRKFRDRGSYQQHKKRHLGEKKHVCEHCGKSFVISSDLKKHIRTHTGEKPFKCKQCGLQFSDGSSYARHEKTHSGRFRFQCGLCSRQYTRRDGCAKHIKKSHKGLDHVDIVSVSVEDCRIHEKLPDVTSEMTSDVTSTMKFNVTSDVLSTAIASTWSSSNVKSLNPTLPDQNQLSSSDTSTIKISPIKKSWQNFESLTLEASRRFKEQNDSIDTCNHGDLSTKCDVTNVSHAIMLDSYQGAPMSQTCYGNIGQTLVDSGQRLTSIPAYSLQTPTGQVYATKLVNYQSVLKY